MKSKIIIFMLLISTLMYSQENIRVNVNSNPPGAAWRISGSNDTSITPTSAKFRKGQTYKIVFSMPGYKTETLTYIGGSGDINVNLKPNSMDDPDTSNTRVNVNSDPQGATWHISGSHDRSTTPASAKFRKGQTYILVFSKQGYKPATITYIGGTGDIFANLEKDISNFTLTVKSNINGAAVFINGQQYGNTPLNASLNEGNYNIAVKAAGYRDFNMSVNLNSNQSVFANLEQNQLTLTVNSNIQGALVFINNQQMGTAPCNLSLNPGNYNVSVKKIAYKDYNININLNSNQNVYANLELNQFTLSINSNVQGALVFLNGKQSGNIPYNSNLNPGTYNIQVRAQGYKSFAASINLNGDQTVYANLDIEKVLNIRIPFGAKIYINNQPQKIDWGNPKNLRDRDKWKTFTFFGDSINTRYSIKVVYFELEIEKTVEFNGGTMTLFADLK